MRRGNFFQYTKKKKMSKKLIKFTKFWTHLSSTRISTQKKNKEIISSIFSEENKKRYHEVVRN